MSLRNDNIISWNENGAESTTFLSFPSLHFVIPSTTCYHSLSSFPPLPVSFPPLTISFPPLPVIIPSTTCYHSLHYLLSFPVIILITPSNTCYHSYHSLHDLYHSLYYMYLLSFPPLHFVIPSITYNHSLLSFPPLPMSFIIPSTTFCHDHYPAVCLFQWYNIPAHFLIFSLENQRTRIRRKRKTIPKLLLPVQMIQTLLIWWPF